MLMLKSSAEKKKTLVTYIVEGHPGRGHGACCWGADDELPFAGLEVWKGIVGWIDRAPEIHVLEHVRARVHN